MDQRQRRTMTDPNLRKRSQSKKTEEREERDVLERYEKDFDEEAFIKSFMKKKQITTKKQALAELRKLIKKEGYYQTKIKDALKKKYPDAFIRKIAQGAFSEAGIPDILMIKDGHYFGFEVKRPVVGIRSKVQEETVRQIKAAGGTAEFVVWPEQAIEVVEECGHQK